MERLSDDDLIELLGALGVLRLEVQELRTLAQNMVPKDELEDRRRRLRLAGFVAAIVILIMFAPFGFLLHTVSSSANEAKTAAESSARGNAALIQDQYQRAVISQQTCIDRNNSQMAVLNLIGKLLTAEQLEPPSVARDQRIAAYSAVSRSAGTLSDCSVYTKQEQDLIAEGAKPQR